MGFKKKIYSLISVNSQIILLYCLLLLLSFVIYRPAFSSYFFQDDWFTFKISNIHSLKEILSFFIPRVDVIYYRPIGMQVYFFIMRSLFGVNSFFFRISTLIIYAFNGLLVYLIFQRLKFLKILSLFGATLYSASVVTYIPFFWSSTFSFVLGPTFFLLSFLFFIRNTKNRPNNLIISLIFYIFGLLTLELIVVLPAILIIWELLYNKGKTIKYIILYPVFLLPYTYLRLKVFPVPLVATYQPKISIFSTLRSYFLWSLNWPEEIGKQMVGSFKINSLFLSDFRSFTNIWISSTFFFVLLLFVPFVIKIIKKLFIKKIIIIKNDLLTIFWYAVSLIPLLVFSNHTFPYYLPIPLVGFVGFLLSQISFLFATFNLKKSIRIIILCLILIIWVYSSIKTMTFNQLIHWAPQRAKISQELVKQAQETVSQSSKTFIVSDSKENKLSLNDQDALQVIFESPEFRTIYVKNQ